MQARAEWIERVWLLLKAYRLEPLTPLHCQTAQGVQKRCRISSGTKLKSARVNRASSGRTSHAKRCGIDRW